MLNLLRIPGDGTLKSFQRFQYNPCVQKEQIRERINENRAKGIQIADKKATRTVDLSTLIQDLREKAWKKTNGFRATTGRDVVKSAPRKMYLLSRHL